MGKRNNPETKKKKPSAEKCRKIRVYPDPKQRKVLKQWLGTVRWTYNQCLAALRSKKCKANMKELRAHCIDTKRSLYALPISDDF